MELTLTIIASSARMLHGMETNKMEEERMNTGVSIWTKLLIIRRMHKDIIFSPIFVTVQRSDLLRNFCSSQFLPFSSFHHALRQDQTIEFITIFQILTQKMSVWGMSWAAKPKRR